VLEKASGARRGRVARIPWTDIVANGPLFATALRVEIID
jgi:hypothetical protein